MSQVTSLTVSVAMATYNGEAFLAPQLRGILAQSRLPNEIVISDDHSTDGTLQIAKSFAKEARAKGVKFSVVTHRGPAGVAKNFSHAVSKTSGDLVALADQDDLWLPNKLEALERHFLNNPALLMVHSDAELVNDQGTPLHMRVLDSLRITPGERLDLLRGRGIHAVVRRNLVTGSTSMIRRELVERAGVIPDGWLHDEWWALVAASSNGLLLDPEVYQHYRQHSRNEVGATRSGLARLVERFAESQTDFQARHRLRHEGLQAYLDSALWQGTAEANALLRGRIAHYQWQQRLGSRRLSRIGPVLATLFSGDYGRYRRGLFDALRDLAQPGA